MPETRVVFYADDDGTSPLFVWLDEQPKKVQDKCIARVERLARLGHELRRPEADFLRDGIHELRIRHGRVNYRVLYFFHQAAAVVAHGLTKEGKVPDPDIEVTLSRKRKYDQDPERHTYGE
jgi:phage-related protein